MQKVQLADWAPLKFSQGEIIISESAVDKILAAARIVVSDEIEVPMSSEDGRSETRRVTCRAFLADRLNHLVLHYRLDCSFQSAPTRHQIAQQLRAIESAATRLEKALGLREPAADANRHHRLPVAIYCRLMSPARRLAEAQRDQRGDEQFHADAVSSRPRGGFRGVSLQRYLDAELVLSRALDGFLTLKRLVSDASREGDLRPVDAALTTLVGNLAELYERVTGKRAGASTDPKTGGVSGPFLRFAQAVCREIDIEQSRITFSKLRDRLRDARAARKVRV